MHITEITLSVVAGICTVFDLAFSLVCAYAGVFWWCETACSCIFRLGRPWYRLWTRNLTLNPH